MVDPLFGGKAVVTATIHGNAHNFAGGGKLGPKCRSTPLALLFYA